tara:strand:+ start:326 stop:619 length:294 start_codon:yes stop_codon:yes gene_type:complete
VKQKSVKLYASESVLEDFYEAIASGNSKILKRVHIPKSDVFYVRKCISEATGETYTLDQVERAMYLEGYLTRNEVLDPDRPRGYCSYDTPKEVSTTQ